jgi:hypothetical protein
MTDAALKALLKRFWPGEEEYGIWAVLDGARHVSVYSTLLNSYMEQSCLYAGDLAFEVERNAPHLVKLEPGDRSARDLLRRAWGDSWGIFAHCREPLSSMRTHFRRLLTVQDWNGRKLLFRFYDPRVLRAYLPTCNAEELKTVFGPVRTFWTESQNPGELLQFSTRGGQLITETLPLEQSVSAPTGP